MSDVSEQAKALAEVMFPDGSWDSGVRRPAGHRRRVGVVPR